MESMESMEDDDDYSCELCDKIDHPQMIQCMCCEQWFHWECVGVDEYVDGDWWLCELCQGKPNTASTGSSTTETTDSSDSSSSENSESSESQQMRSFQYPADVSTNMEKGNDDKKRDQTEKSGSKVAHRIQPNQTDDVNINSKQNFNQIELSRLEAELKLQTEVDAETLELKLEALRLITEFVKRKEARRRKFLDKTNRTIDEDSSSFPYAAKDENQNSTEISKWNNINSDVFDESNQRLGRLIDFDINSELNENTQEIYEVEYGLVFQQGSNINELQRDEIPTENNVHHMAFKSEWRSLNMHQRLDIISDESHRQSPWSGNNSTPAKVRTLKRKYTKSTWRRNFLKQCWIIIRKHGNIFAVHSSHSRTQINSSKRSSKIASFRSQPRRRVNCSYSIYKHSQDKRTWYNQSSKAHWIQWFEYNLIVGECTQQECETSRQSIDVCTNWIKGSNTQEDEVERTRIHGSGLIKATHQRKVCIAVENDSVGLMKVDSTSEASLEYGLVQELSTKQVHRNLNQNSSNETSSDIKKNTLADRKFMKFSRQKKKQISSVSFINKVESQRPKQPTKGSVPNKTQNHSSIHVSVSQSKVFGGQATEEIDNSVLKVMQQHSLIHASVSQKKYCVDSQQFQSLSSSWMDNQRLSLKDENKPILGIKTPLEIYQSKSMISTSSPYQSDAELKDDIQLMELTNNRSQSNKESLLYPKARSLSRGQAMYEMADKRIHPDITRAVNKDRKGDQSSLVWKIVKVEPWLFKKVQFQLPSTSQDNRFIRPPDNNNQLGSISSQPTGSTQPIFSTRQQSWSQSIKSTETLAVQNVTSGKCYVPSSFICNSAIGHWQIDSYKNISMSEQPVSSSVQNLGIGSYDSSNMLYNSGTLSSMGTQRHVLMSSKIAARHTVSKDLPIFMTKELSRFILRFINSTNMCGYGEHENLERLDKYIQGKARIILEYLSLIPNSVSKILETPFDKYGRQNIAINDELEISQAATNNSENHKKVKQSSVIHCGRKDCRKGYCLCQSDLTCRRMVSQRGHTLEGDRIPNEPERQDALKILQSHESKRNCSAYRTAGRIYRRARIVGVGVQFADGNSLWRPATTLPALNIMKREPADIASNSDESIPAPTNSRVLNHPKDDKNWGENVGATISINPNTSNAVESVEVIGSVSN